MLNKVVSDYIQKHRLLQNDGKYLVALSGGADSVALLRVLLALGYQVEAAHCNFKLRGEESDRDEHFSKELCNSLGVSFHCAHFDTLSYARQHGVSIEMAARDLRYGWFAGLCKDAGFDALCVAHHREDSVETLIMNLVRGTGLRGMRGILPNVTIESPHYLRIVRPLLCVNRMEIEAFLHELHQSFVTDSTNLQDNIMRNFIRTNVLPLLETLNPRAVCNIQRSAEHLSAAYEIYQKSIDQIKQEIIRNGTFPRQSVTNEELLYELIHPYGFSSAQASMIYRHLDSPSGKIFSSKSYYLLLDHQNVIVQMKGDSISPFTIPEDGQYILSEGSRISIKRNKLNDMKNLPRQKTVACVNAAEITFPLLLRTVQSSDRFMPLGMSHHKLVNRYFIDIKFPLIDRRRQLVLLNGDGKIIWLVNHRIDNRFRITEHTKDIYFIELQPCE